MIDYEFGNIVLVPFPFTDQTTTKKRPAVVVSSVPYHREHPDLILMAITSRLRSPASFGEVGIAQWESASLLKPSVIKPIFATIEKGLVLKKLGRLLPEDRLMPRRALQVILGE